MGGARGECGVVEAMNLRPRPCGLWGLGHGLDGRGGAEGKQSEKKHLVAAPRRDWMVRATCGRSA